MSTGVSVLYGKDPERERIKQLLTSDNVLQKGEIYDYKTPWSTTKADDYKVWQSTSKRIPDSKQDTLKSNICFGSYASSAATSVQNCDYNRKSVAKVGNFKPSNKINIIDLDPKYQAENPSKSSSYSDEFDKEKLMLHHAHNKTVIHGRGNPITNYLRSTHFTLGSDETSNKTEAQAAFSGQTVCNANASLATQRAQQDKRTNHVFRGGDYNMTEQTAPKSVFSLSYKGAGIASTQKGYDHVITSRTNLKTDDLKQEITRKLYDYLHKNFQNQRDPTQVNLRQAFAFFDKKRTGFISQEGMSNILKRLVGPHEQGAVNEIISEFDTNKDGKVDYLDFENFLNKRFPPVDKESSLYADTYKPSLLEGATRPRSSENPVDGAYQINTHFSNRKLETNKGILPAEPLTSRFGETTENQESLYKSSFGQSNAAVERPSIAKPPPPSQMLPVEQEHMKSTNSIHREDYRNFPNLNQNDQIKTLKFNKSLHENVSFSLANNPEEDRELRMKSLTASSYQPKTITAAKVIAKGFESQWNHLKTEDALPELTSGPAISEHADNYNFSFTGIAHKEYLSNTALRQGRVKDEKMSHLSLGNDSNTGKHSEMATKFSKPKMNLDVPAAGIKGGPLPEHKHIHHSEESTSLSDPSVKSLQDSIKQTILKKYYNPRDPLNINLQKAFKEFDKNNTGKITVTGLREACKRLQLPVTDAILNRYFVCLDKNGDGSIDYNEFADELGIHIQHISKNGMTTVMKSDYTPIEERGGAGSIPLKEAKTEVIHPSHYFHMTHDSATLQTTTQNDFSHPLDQFQTIGVGTK